MSGQFGGQGRLRLGRHGNAVVGRRLRGKQWPTQRQLRPKRAANSPDAAASSSGSGLSRKDPAEELHEAHAAARDVLQASRARRAQLFGAMLETGQLGSILGWAPATPSGAAAQAPVAPETGAAPAAAAQGPVTPQKMAAPAYVKCCGVV